MQITEIGSNARKDLIDLLSLGFPQRSSAQWALFLDRVHVTLVDKNLPNALGSEGPRIGWLLGNPDAPDGVLLGLPNPHGGLTDSGQPRLINMSSWFVKEDKRAQAIWMLRKISRLPGHQFTDLTPSVAVARMLPSLGYSQISQGIVRLYTPESLITSNRGWRVVAAEQVIAHQSDPLMAQALHDHHALGCIVLGLDRAGQCLPVVIKRRIPRHLVRRAEVIFLPPPDAHVPNPRQAIPALARTLLAHGILQLEIEKPIDPQLRIPMLVRTVGDRPRFARGDYPPGGISHLYSELVYD